jgi:hypothetical protein
MKKLLLVGFLAGTVLNALADDSIFAHRHWRLQSDGHGGSNIYGHEGHRGTMDDSGYFANKVGGWHNWNEEDPN